MLIHRGTAFSAQRHFIEQVAASEKIEPRFGTTVEAILGGQMVEKLRVRGAAGSEELAVAGVFAYIGLEPNTGFLPAEIKRDARGGILTNDAQETAVRGIWAAGAVRSGCGGSLADAMTDATRTADAVAARLK
jgi:thioredoxin reductase (NADPH)